MKMPTTTNNKVEAKLASTDLGDAAKQCINCLEKKVRNLEKRKSRIEQNQEKAKKGTKLEKEQEVSLNQYEQVAHDLEFARELHKQFLQIYTEHEKMAKKQAKREKAERQALEIKRISEILQLQSLLDSLGGDKVREDFKTGKHGAVVLTEDNLQQLDELYQVISPSRDDSGEDYPHKLTTAAEHLVNILEGKDRQVVGTTYKEIKELITLIKDCGYFETAKKTVVEEVAAEDSQTNEELEDTNAETVLESPTDDVEVTGLVSEPPSQQQQPMDLTMGSSDVNQSRRDIPSQPLNTREQDAFFAPSTVSYQVDSEPQFSQTGHVSVSRVPDFQSFTNNRPFQFIQTSYVMPESIPVVVDPAVIAAQPAGASSLQFISQGFDASSASQKQQDLSHSSSGMQHQPTPDYSSQSYAQNDNIYSTSGVDESDQISSHSNMMGHIGEDGVTYEIPPTIPMPPSQSQQDQALDQQQQQQQEKKFQMNASAPVFQSMYSQTSGGQTVSGSSPAGDQQVQTSTNEYSNSPGGEFGQQTGDFQQNYQGNNGFQNYRGSRSGFRNRGGSAGSRGSTAGGPVQNGFSSRGGSTNTNNSRGGRGGGYQNYQSNNSYRPEGFQKNYSSGGNNYSGNNYQPRGGVNNTSSSGFSRGGAGGSRGANNSPRGGPGGAGAPRGGSGIQRGSSRGTFNRPLPAQ
ncbi:caprin-1-like isoform X1 [Biomphalaria glabrata]|uniref:Caprin-1-like isoform X1 n=1 Tax=Biomphalaria glabrata TaxID=6526 RepID=A0A9U8EIP2_BIOGL|nr:caprin-1-like isoform X1 [Biomphalaria glabrata]